MAREENGRSVLDSPLHDGEPVFILRGQDALMADTVRFWIKLAQENGVPPVVIERARRIARMADSYTPQKMPD